MKRICVPFIIAAVCAVALATVSTTTAARAAVPIAGTFHPLDPARILDTRDGTGVAGGHVGPLGAAQVIAVDVTGVGGVPDTGVGAVTLNLTITQAQGAGYATVWPCGTARPYASNVNFVLGVDLANQVTVKVGANGHICLFSSVTTQIVGDVNGWWGDGFESAPGFHFESVDPARILDSRTGTGMPGGVARQIAAGETLPVTVAGVAGIPLHAAAVSFNLTATNVDGPGYVTVFPCGTPRPYASNINFASGVDVANLVTSRIGANGAVCLYSPAAADLIMDIEGYFNPWTGALRPVFTPLEPVRVLDTRDGTGVVERRVGPLGARQIIEVQIAGVNGVPADARSVVLNVTVTHARARGWVTVFPCGNPLPWVSNLNFVRGIDRANAVKAKIGAGGKVCFYAEAQTEIVADQFGYFALAAV
ncbi:MAG TPA: hypothetical protein VM282_02420 [Acidimicrobiales bacterium]|nr:hypothetical protein [Acidimicrobiales bacterium]